MKKHWSTIVLGVVVIVVLIPLTVAFGLSFRVIITDTTNEWIGFWGGYMGSIIGGLVTLWVMQVSLKDGKENLNKTLEFEKKKLRIERKTEFNDELLKQLMEYQSKISHFCEYFVDMAEGRISREEDTKYNKQDERIRELTMVANIILIKLSSKKENKDYIGIDSLIDVIERINEQLNNTSQNIKGKSKEEGADIAVKGLRIIHENAKQLLDRIEEYYKNNEQNQDMDIN